MLQNRLAEHRDVVAHAGGTFVVEVLRAALLAEADDHHLHHAALVRAAEVGVGLDAAADDNAVRLRRVAVNVDIPTVLGFADVLRFHRRANRRAAKFLRDAVALNDGPLALGRRAAVASHGGNNKRLCAKLLQAAADLADDKADVCNAAAAAGDGNLHAGLYKGADIVSGNQLAHATLHILDLRPGEVLAHARHARQICVL